MDEKPKQFKVWVDGSATIGGDVKVDYDDLNERINCDKDGEMLPEDKWRTPTQEDAEQYVIDNGVDQSDVNWEMQDVVMMSINGEEV